MACQGQKSEKPSRLARFSYVLEKTGLTQKAFSEKIGLRPDTISKIKNGERNLSASVAAKIEKEFGWRVQWLLHGTGPRKVEGTAEKQKEYKDKYEHPELDTVFVNSEISYYCDRCWQQVGWMQEICPKCGGKIDWEHSGVSPPWEH
jgi:transcriptional regulator with XRE-family HTH domain